MIRGLVRRDESSEPARERGVQGKSSAHRRRHDALRDYGRGMAADKAGGGSAIGSRTGQLGGVWARPRSRADAERACPVGLVASMTCDGRAAEPPAAVLVPEEGLPRAVPEDRRGHRVALRADDRLGGRGEALGFGSRVLRLAFVHRSDVVAPLRFHAWVEFGNRLITVGVTVVHSRRLLGGPAPGPPPA